MFNPRVLFKSIARVQNNFVKNGTVNYSTKTKSPSIKFKKCLLVCKLSRYEFERNRHRMLNKSMLEQELRYKGADYERLLHYHELHKAFHEKVANTMREMNIQVRVVNRLSFHEEDINWADVIVPSGGDGTFLLAASKILNNDKPVIGFNSDPNRSEGHLCLPKRYSENIKEAIERLRAGDFKWLMRSRIRTTLTNQKGDQSAIHLHECGDYEVQRQVASADFQKNGKALPYLALNEVFMGETLSARVSHLEMNIDDCEETTNMKCSGLCVSTGTGSTSWNLSINRLPTQTVVELLRLVKDRTGVDNTTLAKELAQTYNHNLVFDPAQSQMGYTIRDLISAGVWPQPKGIQPRGFASKLKVRSCCYDAGLVIDGGISFSFNDGTLAILEIYPEDTLRTVILAE